MNKVEIPQPYIEASVKLVKRHINPVSSKLVHSMTMFLAGAIGSVVLGEGMTLVFRDKPDRFLIVKADEDCNEKVLDREVVR